MRSVKFALGSILVILVLLILPSIVTPSFATKPYRVNFQSSAAGPGWFIDVFHGPAANIIGSGTLALSGTALTDAPKTTTLQIPNYTITALAAKVYDHENERMGGSVVGRWTNATGDYRLVVRLSPGEMPPGMPPEINYTSAFFYLNNTFILAVNYTGFIISHGTLTPISGEGVVVGITGIGMLSTTVCLIEVILQSSGVGFAWISAPITLDSYTLPGANELRINVKLV